MDRLRKVIYLDTLIFLNTVITFLMLLTTRRLTNVRTSVLRIVVASFIGGFTALSLLAPPINALLTAVLKIVMGGMIVMAAFFTGDSRKLLKCASVFLFLTFLYAGAAFFFAQIFDRFIVYRNGFMYINLSFWMLIVLSIVLFLVLKLLNKFYFKEKQAYAFDISLFYHDRTVNGKALYDSGNFLTDCYTGRPVVIVSQSFIQPLLSAEELLHLNAMEQLSAADLPDSFMLRLIPVRTVSGGRTLPAFTCEKAIVKNGDAYYSVPSVSVAVTESPLGSGFDALINSQIIN